MEFPGICNYQVFVTTLLMAWPDWPWVYYDRRTPLVQTYQERRERSYRASVSVMSSFVTKVKMTALHDAKPPTQWSDAFSPRDINSRRDLPLSYTTAESGAMRYIEIEWRQNHSVSSDVCRSVDIEGRRRQRLSYCTILLQSLPVSCHFRGCEAPLSRIVSGAIASELALPLPFNNNNI